MSSPAAIQAPRRPRSIAGPVVLIVLGIVFLMGTMGMLHWLTLGQLYARFWPVLIILWGVIKLVEHQRAQREGARASGIGVVGVFLLLFVIVTGLIASQARHVNWQGLHDEIGIDDEDLTGLFGQSFNYTDEVSQEFPASGSLHVISDRGAITVIPSDAKKLKISINKKVHADNQQDADRYNVGSKPQITASGNTVTLNANTQGAGEHGVATDMNVYVPQDVALVISSKHGDVKVSSRNANLDISAQHGQVTIEDIKGNANLDLQHSSAKVSNLSGDLTVDGRINEFSASNIKGSARLTGEFMESVRLTQISKTVGFKSSRTDFQVAKLDGTLDLDSGDLRATGVQGPTYLSTRNKDIRLDAISGELRLQDTNGSVEVVIQKLGNIQIDNKNGEIQLSLPSQAAFRVEARAVNGEIESDFNELKIENGEKQASASGSVGNGSITLRLNNEHGTIEIRKGSAGTPPAPPRPPREAEEPETTEN